MLTDGTWDSKYTSNKCDVCFIISYWWQKGGGVIMADSWALLLTGYQEQHKRLCRYQGYFQWDEVELRQPSLFGSVVWTESANFMVVPVKVLTKDCHNQLPLLLQTYSVHWKLFKRRHVSSWREVGILCLQRTIEHLLRNVCQTAALFVWLDQRLDQTFCFLYVLTWHRGDSSKLLNKRATENQHSYKYLHNEKQALVYLWLEKPNIARVMHSQSVCPLYFQGSLGNWYVSIYSSRLSTQSSSDKPSALDVFLTLRQRHLQQKKRS